MSFNFYRSHLRDIRDRSVLRLFESSDVGGGAMPPGIVPPQTWDQDQSYFSEPEFDSEYQHQHIHKTKVCTQYEADSTRLFDDVMKIRINVNDFRQKLNKMVMPLFIVTSSTTSNSEVIFLNSEIMTSRRSCM